MANESSNWYDGLAGIFGNKKTSESGFYDKEGAGVSTASIDAMMKDYQTAGGSVGTGMNFDSFAKTRGLTSGQSSGLAGLGAVKTGVDIGTGIGNLWLGYEQYGLNKDIYNTNKENAAKEYAMKKDAYDRNVARADSIGNQMNAGKVTL